MRRAPAEPLITDPSDSWIKICRYLTAADGRAFRRLTPPLSDSGQRKIYEYLTANQFDTKETTDRDNLTFHRRSRSDPSACLRRGRRLAPPAPFVYICDISSRAPGVLVSVTLGSLIYGYHLINRNRLRSKVGGRAYLPSHTWTYDRLATCRDQ